MKFVGKKTVTAALSLVVMSATLFVGVSPAMAEVIDVGPVQVGTTSQDTASDTIAVSNGGTAYGDVAGVSTTGSAGSGTLAVSGLGPCASSNGIGVSGTGCAVGVVGVSGTNNAAGWVAVTGLGDAYSWLLSVSGTGFAGAGVLAVSGTGDVSSGTVGIGGFDTAWSVMGAPDCGPAIDGAYTYMLGVRHRCTPLVPLGGGRAIWMWLPAF